MEGYMLSMKDTISKNINDIDYELKLLNTSRAFITAEQLIKLGLPSLGAGLDNAMLGDEEEFLESQTFATIAILITRQMDEVDVLSIVKELLKDMTADKAPVDFEKYFRGRMDLLIEIIEFALRENYGSLFIGTSLIGKLMKSMKEFQTRQTINETAEMPNVQE